MCSIIVILLCMLIWTPIHTTAFLPVVTDDRITPFSFTAEVYDATLVVNGLTRQYVVPTVKHISVAEPFGGNPSGSVEFSITSGQDSLVFYPETLKLGNFFFVQLYTSTADITRKHQVYELTIQAVFTSDSTAVNPIQLRNISTIRIRLLDRNENCPFFSKQDYSFEVPDNRSIYRSFGKVATSDADADFNAQAYFYLDIAEDGLPFRVDPYNGDLFVTRPLTQTAFSYAFGPQRDEASYKFRVHAAQRGDSSLVRCNIVSLANVRVNVVRTTAKSPSIIVDPLSDIQSPGVAGIAYARISVIDPGMPKSEKPTLHILEPDMREKFELIPSGEASEWHLFIRRTLSSISLAARISMTLEAGKYSISGQDGAWTNSLTKQRSRYALDLPVVSKSTYRLSFPDQVLIRVSEAALPNCTIAILRPNLPFNMSNSDFVYTVLQNSHTGNSNESPIALTTTGAVVLKQQLNVDLMLNSKYRNGNQTSIVLPFTVVDRNNLLLSSSSKSRLVVEILDINDNDPVVRNNGSVYEVRENAVIGSVVFHIDAFDPDRSRMKLSYSLYDSNNLPFTLSRDGELLVSKELDAETMPEEFTLYVWVSDSGVSLPRSVLAIFTVHILDVNEYAPQFVELSCEAWLSVDSSGSLVTRKKSGIVLGRYSAEDIDRDSHNAVGVRLASSSLANPCFAVDESTGELSVSCSYLGRPNSDIILTLVASDGSKTSEVPFEITIHLVSEHLRKSNFTQRCQPSGVYEDLQKLQVRRKQYQLSLNAPQSSQPVENRHRPVFPSDLPSRIHVPENLPLGTVVLQFAASDEDSVDHSVAGQIVYGVEAISSVGSEDLNSELGTSISEGDAQQAFLLKPVEHSDKPVFSPLLSSPYGVELVVAAPLDRESTSSYSLLLHACDLGSPPLCTSFPLHIFLEDMDDNAPEIMVPSASDSTTTTESHHNLLSVPKKQAAIPGVITVPEDVEVDSRIGQITANDRDISDEVRYRLLTHTDMFKIHHRTGKIRLLRSLDRETHSSYELIVEAAGQARRTLTHQQSFGRHYSKLLQLAVANSRAVYQRRTTTRVDIVVTDVNDNAPVFASPGAPGNVNSSDPHSVSSFGTDGYRLFIPEDMPEGAYLTTLLARDMDEGVNALIGYSLFGKSGDADCFQVERLTGVVRLAAGCKLNKLTGQSIHLAAWASDHGNPQKSSKNDFVIHVIPVRINVFPPAFHAQPALYFGFVEENLATGSEARDAATQKPLRLEASDPDGGGLSFHIVGGSGIGYFYIDQSGFIRTERVLDAESVPDDGGYWLTVHAVEEHSDLQTTVKKGIISTESNGPKRALAEVFIQVTDVNDNYPIPLAPEYVSRLAENSPANLLVASVSATDMDRTGGPLRYRISAGDAQGHFFIDPESGAIRTTARPLDREAVLREQGTDELDLVISISDRGTPTRASRVHVRVALLDENDQTPTFVSLAPSSRVEKFDTPSSSSKYHYNFRIYRGADQDRTLGCVGRVFAIDLDDSVNGSVVYWRDTVSDVVSPDQTYVDGGFNVHPTTGLICPEVTLPRPDLGHYRIRVYAKDRGQPARIANNNNPVTVLITVLPSPSAQSTQSAEMLQFTQSPPKHFVLQSSQQPGQKLFTFLVADPLDPEGTSLTYMLTASNGSLNVPFALGQKSSTEAYVILADHSDLSEASTFLLLLTVSNGYQRLTAKVNVTCDHRDSRRPEFVPEKFVMGKSVIQEPLVDLSNKIPTLGASGLQLNLRVNESVLVGTRVCVLPARLPATGAENRSLEYAVASVGQETTRELFNLNSRTGEVRVARTLDHESIRRHYLLISVRDPIRTALVSHINVFIAVDDTNEHAPQFLARTESGDHRGAFVFFTKGFSPVGTVVGHVVAFDPDTGENGRIGYHMVGGDHAGQFKIDSTTGAISITKALIAPPQLGSDISWVSKVTDVQQLPRVYRILVAAKDHGSPVARSNHSEVVIRVIPGPGGVDVPAPQFNPTSKTIHFTVLENCPAGFVIASMAHFLTPTSAAHGFFRFDLVTSYRVPLEADRGPRRNIATPRIDGDEMKQSNLFHIVHDTGLLVTLVSLDRERHGDLYRLLVRVRGSHGIRAEISSFLALEVHISDVNDNAPTIQTSRSIRGTVKEDAEPGTIVNLQCSADQPAGCNSNNPKPVQILASDPDMGVNGQIVYQLVGASDSDELFLVDPVTGLLQLAPGAQLDRESVPIHWLMVQVTDRGSPALSANGLVHITVAVMDVNDSPPVFEEISYTRTLMLPTYPSELVAQLNAHDADLNDTVQFRLVNNADSKHFTLDAHTGQLRIAPNSDPNPQPFPERNMLVEVEAYDSHLPKPHVSRTNITIFTQRSSLAEDLRPLVVDPEKGLDVELVEHFRGREPLRLGQLLVRNAPIGAIHRFIVLTPIRGLTVDGLTGTVWATGEQTDDELDREQTDQVTLHVLVRDTRHRLGRAVVRIRLTDVNDHSPVFIGQPYHAVFCLSATDRPKPMTTTSSPATLTETLCTRPNQFKVTAVDDDAGQNGSITYHLASIRPRAEPPLLAIDANTGQLTLLRLIPPDWTGRQMDAVVVATDGGGLSTSATVAIHLVSGEGPRFSASHYTATVPESAPIGEAITTVEATSPTQTSSLIYRIVQVKCGRGSMLPGSVDHNFQAIDLADSPFLLEFNAGIIRLVNSLDYETATGYLLLLEVLDTSTSLSARVHLSINVTDVNDVAPKFTDPQYAVYVSERHAPAHFVLQLEATDPDSGYGGKISFSLAPHRPDSESTSLLTSHLLQSAEQSVEHFHCDPETGTVTLARRLNYHTEPVHRFWAVVTDQAAVPLQSRVPVTVHVLDSNDHAPRFHSSDASSGDEGDCLYTARVNERAPPGSFLLRLMASDPDVNDTLRYRSVPTSMAGWAAAAWFRLDPFDGSLRWIPARMADGRVAWPHPIVNESSSSLSMSTTIGVLQFDVLVTDGLHTTTCPVRVEVDAVNWHAPSFPAPKHERWHVSETSTTLGRILPAIDPDHGLFGSVTYKLIGGHDYQRFRLDKNTGELFAPDLLDREAEAHFELLIRATDGGNLFDHLLLDLYVMDANDNPPKFTQSTYEITLFSELYGSMGAYPRQTNLQLQAIDADDGPNAQVVYRLFRLPSVDQTNNGPVVATSSLDVDPRTGHLMVIRALDDVVASGVDTLQLFVEACNSPSTGPSDTWCSSPVKIAVHVVNQSAELGVQVSCASSSVLENDHTMDREVAICRTDPNNLSGKFLLTSSVLIDSGQLITFAFRIDPATGRVYTIVPLDYERGAAYRLHVEFHRHMDKPRVAVIAHTQFVIDLIDVNDCTPQLDVPIYTLDLLESVPVGTRITRIMAHDADADGTDPITYSLWPTSVQDSELSAPQAHRGQRFQLDQVARSNPEVGLVRQQFEVDAQGWIILKSGLDFEVKRQHQFKVVTMDAVGHWNASLVTIDVIDVNDNAPHWPLEKNSNTTLDSVLLQNMLQRQILHAQVSIPENWSPSANSIIYQLAIEDPDVEASSLPTFYMLPESNSDRNQVAKSSTHFTVSSSGAIRLIVPLDREMSASFSLRFRASDGVFITQDTFVLQVNVKDVNDHAPMCIEPQRRLSLSEDTATGQVLTHLLATDADAEPVNSNVSYVMVAGDRGLFALDSETGIVRLHRELDFEAKQSHTLTVRASDSGQLSCLFHLSLDVVDVNDNPPEFDNDISIAPIPEDAPLGSLVGKITAHDPDMVDANRLVYSLQAAHDASFSIVPQTGLLKVSQTLDRETKSEHILTVLVVDGPSTSSTSVQRSKRFTASTTVHIKLLDVNDSPPQFVNSSAHTLRVSELAPIGHHLTRLKAVSLDEGNNSVVRYRLLVKQPEFSLNDTTGDLRLEAALDHESVSSYFLTVEARDHGHPPLSTNTVVTVHVDDENDNRPAFVGRQPLPTDLATLAGIPPNETAELTKDSGFFYYTFTIVENSRNGTVVGRLKAVDADSADNGKLRYHLPTANSSKLFAHLKEIDSALLPELLAPQLEAQTRFALDPTTGQLRALFEPDREAIDDFWLVAAVSDHGSPNSLTSETLVHVRVLDINDCPPVFEKMRFEFIIEVDRAGNISGCYEIRPAASPTTTTTVIGQSTPPRCDSPRGGRVLIGRLPVTDSDAHPNAGPFTCQLLHSAQATSMTGDRSRGGALFFVRNASMQNQSEQSVGECLLYSVDQLPVGSQSFVLRANDNGLTALHTSVTINVRVVRQANLPPEIVRGNATLTYYRGSSRWNTQLRPDPSPSGQSTGASASLVIARVTVKDRTAHDRLTFELVPTGPTGSRLFSVDRYDGTVRLATSLGRPDAQSSVRPGMEHGSSETGPVQSSAVHPLSRLDSGLYPLRIRVSNASLSSEETMQIRVVAITDEMLESATVIRISNLLPNLFYMENYDRRLRAHLASLLLADASDPRLASETVQQNSVYILSVQEADASLSTAATSTSYLVHRKRRVPRGLDRAVDVLVSVYDSQKRQFIQPKKIAEAIGQAADRMSTEFNGRVQAIHDVCTPQFCPRGQCETRVTIDPDHGAWNRIEVHRVSEVAPRFSLVPRCRCPRHFTGTQCDTPLNACSLATCPAPRVCVPKGARGHLCVCPPPRTGPSCESVQPIGEANDACYSERCFTDREQGPLQFTGGSFIHWELVNPNPNHLELEFHMRTRQSTGPLLSVRWSALRAFQLRLGTGGRLVVSATGLHDGLPSADWLVSAEPVSTRHWHRVRLVLTATTMGEVDQADMLLFQPVDDVKPNVGLGQRQWWVELTVDGIHPRSTSIDWDAGDPVQQGILLGADPVDGFRPISTILPLTSAPVIESSANFDHPLRSTNSSVNVPVIRSGIVGCFREIRINQIKPPYQVNYQATLAHLQSNTAANSPHNQPSLILMHTHQLTYNCDLMTTVSGPCAAGPCLHGGQCAVSSQPHGPSASYACRCPALFHGRHCERTGDACLLRPCQNGGSCQALYGPSVSKTPTNSGLAAYRCVCPAGVSGLHCELLHDASTAQSISANSQHALSESGVGCRSAHLVLQSRSQSTHSRSSVGRGSWTATVPPRRDGTSSSTVCLHHGSCMESPSGPLCVCPTGWQGARCEHDIDECRLADTLFQTSSERRSGQSNRELWASSSHGPGSGGLCSPFEVGRGVCVNTPGSYQCNCSLGFGGRHCESKNLIPLTPDPNALGLTQLHVYIIVGLLAFLFLAALTTIIILACRARGLLGASMESDARASKSHGVYMWPTSKQKSQPSHKSPPPSALTDAHFYRYNHSGGSSMANVPFLVPSPGHPVHRQHPMGSHSSCHSYAALRAHRRASVASSTFAIPGHGGNDSTTALLTGGGIPADCIKRSGGGGGSNSSAAPTMTDYMDRDDASMTGASRLMLYPTAGGEPVPVVMMMSPSMGPYAGSICSIAGSRTGPLPRYSPASSTVLYAPANLSGTGTPTNQGSAPYIAYNMDGPNSAMVHPRQPHLHHQHHHSPSQMAFYPPHGGPYMAHPSHPGQLIAMRPGSAVGSDRLSLGSGSDRFSAHSSQVLVQPNTSGAYPPPQSMPPGYYPPNGHPLQLHPQQLSASRPVSVEPCHNGMESADNTRTLRPSEDNGFEKPTSSHLDSTDATTPQAVTSHNGVNQRPMPANQHHFRQAPGPVHAWHVPNVVTCQPPPSQVCAHHIHHTHQVPTGAWPTCPMDSNRCMTSFGGPPGPVAQPCCPTGVWPNTSIYPIHAHPHTDCWAPAVAQLPAHLQRSCPQVYVDPAQLSRRSFTGSAKLVNNRYSYQAPMRPHVMRRTAVGAAARRSQARRNPLSGLPPLASRPRSAHISRPMVMVPFDQVDLSTPDIHTAVNGDYVESVPMPDGDSTPTLPKSNRPQPSDYGVPFADEVALDELKPCDPTPDTNISPNGTLKHRLSKSAFQQPHATVNTKQRLHFPELDRSGQNGTEADKADGRVYPTKLNGSDVAAATTASVCHPLDGNHDPVTLTETVNNNNNGHHYATPSNDSINGSEDEYNSGTLRARVNHSDVVLTNGSEAT